MWIRYHPLELDPTRFYSEGGELQVSKYQKVL